MLSVHCGFEARPLSTAASLSKIVSLQFLSTCDSFWQRLRLTLDMIKFEHSVFALPFALTGALLAWRDANFDISGLALASALDCGGDGGRALGRHGV